MEGFYSLIELDSNNSIEIGLTHETTKPSEPNI